MFKFIKKLFKNDPVWSCESYNVLGCAHVDGIGCGFPDCDILHRFNARSCFECRNENWCSLFIWHGKTAAKTKKEAHKAAKGLAYNCTGYNMDI